jgi:alanine dehydrogenase
VTLIDCDKLISFMVTAFALSISDSLLIEQEVSEADVVIGAVLLPGGAAPKLVTREMIKKMKGGLCDCGCCY